MHVCAHNGQLGPRPFGQASREIAFGEGKCGRLGLGPFRPTPRSVGWPIGIKPLSSTTPFEVFLSFAHRVLVGLARTRPLGWHLARVLNVVPLPQEPARVFCGTLGHCSNNDLVAPDRHQDALRDVLARLASQFAGQVFSVSDQAPAQHAPSQSMGVRRMGQGGQVLAADFQL